MNEVTFQRTLREAQVNLKKMQDEGDDMELDDGLSGGMGGKMLGNMLGRMGMGM